ncbi:hypothetical protein DSECCO2_522150 [anaerobic digester metagenome]
MTETTTTENQFSIKTRNKYLFLIASLTVFNIISFTVFIKTGGYDIHGNYLVKDTIGNLKTALICFLFSLPILSLLIGLLVAIFPYRQLEYSKKYFRSFLLTLRFINILFAIGLILIIIMTLLGWYPPKTADNSIESSTKEQAITTFKTEMKSLSDSANFYFDIAITEIEQGNDKNKVSDLVTPKILFFQNELDRKSRAFYQIATDAGLSKDEYEKVFEDLKLLFQPIADKNEKLKANGIDIK